MKNKGLHQHRFKNNPEESAFAAKWEKECEYGRLLNYLLGDGSKPVEPTPRDREVAATVIQWLGSPVGQSFLAELGYEKVKS